MAGAPGCERLAAFSDGVLAVIITIMVLELKVPGQASFAALEGLWPTFVSYVVSYLFVAIVWINHNHLLRFTERATPALIWANFGFLFAISLVPFTTEWLASTQLARAPLVVYAAVFVLANAAYLYFEREALLQGERGGQLRVGGEHRRARTRSLGTLAGFACAGLLGFASPHGGFLLVCACVLSYLRPAGGSEGRRATPSDGAPS